MPHQNRPGTQCNLRIQISNLAYELGERAHVVLQRVLCTMVAASTDSAEIFNRDLTTCTIRSSRPEIATARAGVPCETVPYGRSRTQVPAQLREMPQLEKRRAYPPSNSAFSKHTPPWMWNSTALTPSALRLFERNGGDASVA